MGICKLPQQIVVPSSGPPKGKTLNEYTWEEISYISSNGLAGEYGFQAGDAKQVTLNGTVGSLTLNNYQTYAYIIGVNHNAELEGNNLIHFQVGKSALTGGVDIAFVDGDYGQGNMLTVFYMNATETNFGGWNNSYMRKTICPAFKNILPAALRNVLKSVTKYTDNTGNSTSESAVTTTTDEIFLLAEYEVSGGVSFGNSNEKSKQAQYAYYSARNSKIKYQHSATGTASYWWLRSPSSSSSAYFVIVYRDGSPVNYSAYFSFGIAPCFCV